MVGLRLAHHIRDHYPPTTLVVTSGVDRISEREPPDRAMFVAKSFDTKVTFQEIERLSSYTAPKRRNYAKPMSAIGQKQTSVETALLQGEANHAKRLALAPPTEDFSLAELPSRLLPQKQLCEWGDEGAKYGHMVLRLVYERSISGFG